MNIDAAQDSLFFLLSKIGWALLSPTNLLIIALCLGVIFLLIHQVSAAKKLLLPTALISFSIMLYPIGDFLMEPLESQFKPPKTFPSDIDGIIILGGGEDLKRSLSWNVAELGSGGDRYIGAADLANLYPDIPVIFTGGSGLIRVQGRKDEGYIAQKLLTSVGIDKKRLIIESNSRNTYENFKYSKPLLPKYRKGKITGTYLLITSAFHMPRAVGIARKQGINVIAYPVDYYSNSTEFRLFGFNMLEHLSVLEKAWREWIGLTVYFMTGKIDHWFPPQTIVNSNLNAPPTRAAIDTE
ncbi:MAG: hypothetical protein ISEC1_P1600 [Thiomicrorhabdus sp.]|nr:MAG: hypothetical protein ISEC1_P1600 [Thiomicrorhabdus sp.]